MPSPAGLLALRTTAFRAMGTDVRVVLPETTPLTACDRVRGLFASWEGTISRFDGHSELCRMNASAGREFPASPLLFGVMQAAVRAARATDGLYDPALGRQMSAIGYSRSFDELGRPAPAPQAAGAGGAWRRIVLDPVTRHITVPAGCAIDLGGIAKGMAVDAAIGTLRTAGVSTALVEAGGDLRVLGRPPAHPHWGIALEHSGGRVVALHRGALATSSTAKRRWGPAGDERHHLIDPSTGRPAARGTEAVTVAARTCAQAEVAAKAALVAGPLAGADMLRRLGLDAIVYPDNGPPVPIGAWPDPDSPWT